MLSIDGRSQSHRDCFAATAAKSASNIDVTLAPSFAEVSKYSKPWLAAHVLPSPSLTARFLQSVLLAHKTRTVSSAPCSLASASQPSSASNDSRAATS